MLIQPSDRRGAASEKEIQFRLGSPSDLRTSPNSSFEDLEARSSLQRKIVTGDWNDVTAIEGVVGAGVNTFNLTPEAELSEDIMTGTKATPVAVRDANWKMKESVSITSRLITVLSPWTGFLIVPLFALANAGVLLSGDVLSSALTNRVTWGVILGLVVGKPLGITLFSMFAVRSGIAELPRGVHIVHVMAAGAVAGIGFTVALFIGGLASEIPGNQDAATIGILAASFLATVLGWALLHLAPDSTTADAPVETDGDAPPKQQVTPVP